MLCMCLYDAEPIVSLAGLVGVPDLDRARLFGFVDDTIRLIYLVVFVVVALHFCSFLMFFNILVRF